MLVGNFAVDRLDAVAAGGIISRHAGSPRRATCIELQRLASTEGDLDSVFASLSQIRASALVIGSYHFS
jgi:hypothetical protein